MYTHARDKGHVSRYVLRYQLGSESADISLARNRSRAGFSLYERDRYAQS